MNGAFADTIMALEQGHLNRLAGWGLASGIAGMLLLLLVWRKRSTMPMPFHFAVQTSLWGCTELVLAGGGFRMLVLRDHAGAVSLDRMLWLTIGLATGYAMVGITLVLVGWFMGRRLGVIGAGIGVTVQGAALVLLHLLLANQTGRLL